MIDLDSLPHLPGCYIFKDKEGAVLYIGKAKDLKKRVSSYLQKEDNDPKTSALLKSASNIDFIATNNEVEALILENTLIKRYYPRFNVKLKDSSRYAFIQLSSEQFPRICIRRDKAFQGNYFGPFISARERDYIFAVIKKTFGLRTCKRLPKRACLRYHLGACSGPCIGKITEAEYAEKVKKAQSVLKGHILELMNSLKKEMLDCSSWLQFERALEIRNEIVALEILQEKQNMERQKKYNEDILSYKIDSGNVYLMLFKVYKGTLEGKEEFVFAYGQNFLEEFIVQYYSENEPPEELILPESLDLPLVEFLELMKGRKVKLTIPVHGEKKALLELAQRNIEITFFGDRKRLEALQEALKLPSRPEVIECFDISHLSGTSAVGSMVQFRGGRPDKSNYRRFRIKSIVGADDYASIAEVVRRRYHRLKEEDLELPDLVIVDGGKGQLSAASQELRKLKLKIPVISIAKEEERIYISGSDQHLAADRDSKASLFIQEMRDEAHRFALAYHRLLRKKGK